MESEFKEFLNINIKKKLLYLTFLKQSTQCYLGSN